MFRRVGIGNPKIIACVALALIAVLAVFLLEQEIGGHPSYGGSQIESELQKVPRGYYSTNKFPNYGGSSSGLNSFLTSGFRLPSNYQTGVFDCSESAAYVEWALEDAGFTASIATSSYCPWGSGGHAWVTVRTTNGYTVAIEPTALTGYSLWDRIKHFFTGRVEGIVYSGDQYQYYYYSPEHQFSNIYDVIEYYGSAGEWDWWLGSWGFI